MRKIVILVICVWLAALLGACDLEKESGSQTTAPKHGVPEDFSFAIRWSCAENCSYDSLTGKLVKDRHADLVTEYQPTDAEKAYFYELLQTLDWNSYPDEYEMACGVSEPSVCRILTVRVNGQEKTIRVVDLDPSYEPEEPKERKYLSVCNGLIDRLMETEAWNALPESKTLFS